MNTPTPTAPDATPATGTEKPSELPIGKSEMVIVHHHHPPVIVEVPVMCDERLILCACIGAGSLLAIAILFRRKFFP